MMEVPYVADVGRGIILRAVGSLILRGCYHWYGILSAHHILWVRGGAEISSHEVHWKGAGSGGRRAW